MFYTPAEFDFQVQELMSIEGKSFADAVSQVHENMLKDEKEYHDWLDEQAIIAERERELEAVTGCDDWYENQYELDTEYN